MLLIVIHFRIRFFFTYISVCYTDKLSILITFKVLEPVNTRRLRVGDKHSRKRICNVHGACSLKYIYPVKKVVMNECGYMEYACTW